MNQKVFPIFNKIPDDFAVSLHMPSSRNGRRFALVSIILSQMQIHHQADFPFLRRLRLKGLEVKAAGSDYFSVVSKLNKNADLLITDQRTKTSAKKVINIDYAFDKYLGEPQSDDVLFLPILFHPNLISDETYKVAEGFAANKSRPIKLLFAGNCDPKTYNKRHFKTKYGLLNRTELLELAKTLPSGKVFFPESIGEFEAAMERGELRNKFVWIDTSKFRLPQTDWLNLLSKAEYFFCTPGVQYPYCQNLNESMACGAVPILQYRKFYHPPLEDAVNCIAFADQNEFASKIDQVLLSGDSIDWLVQSNSAIKYHQENLSLDHVKSRLSAFIEDPKKTRLTWVLAGKK